MILGQSGAKKHPEQRTSENVREHDPTDCHVTHDPSLLAITASGTIGMWMMTRLPRAMEKKR
jgi:hypothetical protein